MALQTYDAAVIQNTSALVTSELERLDQSLHLPLTSFTYSRDIQLREDVTFADESSSFTLSSFAAAGGTEPKGKAWVAPNSTVITGVAVDIKKLIHPLNPWGMQLSWSIFELESAIKTGRPIDMQKYQGMRMKYHQDIDHQVYIGDKGLNQRGLLNQDSENVKTMTFPKGASGKSDWVSKTPKEILDDVNSLLSAAWLSSAYAVVPRQLLVSPSIYSLLVSRLVSEAGNVSILKYLQDNTIANTNNGQPLEILPCKWCSKAVNQSGERMLAYTKEMNYVRFPLVPLRSVLLQYNGLAQIAHYVGKVGVIEVVYPETMHYAEGHVTEEAIKFDNPVTKKEAVSEKNTKATAQHP